jgi:GDP-L-fucose synthase
LNVDDMAAVLIYVMPLDYDIYETNTETTLSHINVGTGVDCTIRTLAETMKKVVGFEGDD